MLDRIQVVIETFGGSVSKTTTTTLAAGASLQITDSTFPVSGNSIKLQHANQPPVQPILDGTLRFNFPAVTPARDNSGLFQPPMPASVTFDGTWTKGNFNYLMGEAFSYAAGQVLLTSIQPTGCPNTATGRVRTGAPMPVGVNPVSVSAACDLKLLGGLGGNTTTEAEHYASGVFQIIAGDGGVGNDPIWTQVGATVVYYAVYKSRRRPEITINTASMIYAHTDEQPLPAARTLVLTNSGGLTLNWTAKAINNSPTSVGAPAWLKLSTTSGSLDSQGTQPIEFSVDTAGLAAGSYSARVTFEGNAWNGSKTIFVTLNFTGVPRLTVSPDSFEFFNTVFFSQQTLILKNEGTLRLIPELVVTSDANWLDAPRFIGSLEPGHTGNITVRASQFPPPNFKQLAPGDYSGQILIKPTANQPAQHDFPPVTIPVVFHVQVPKDELAILPGSVTPATNEPIKLNTEYTNFRADVTYRLGTRDNADLALRLFDETGNLQGSSDFIRVSKSDGLVASRRLTIPKVVIATGGLGTTPSKLILRAVFIDRALLTTIKSTPETDHIYAVEPAIKLSLGFGSSVADFQPAFPGELHAGPWNLAEAGWPTAAVVDLPKGAAIRGVTLTARLFRSSGLSRFYTTRATPVPAGFEGRLLLDLPEIGFKELSEECSKLRADIVQFRANVVNLETATIEESPQLELPVERINLIAADPPFGTTLPRSEPHMIKLTAEYNVPNFGTRRIHELIDPGDLGCVRPAHPLLQKGVLGPGRGQFTYEVTAFFPVISATKKGFTASILMREENGDSYALSCDDSNGFNFSDRVTLPAAPNQTVAAADATLKIVTNPSARAVDVSAPRQSLASVAANSAAVDAAAQPVSPARASPRRHANEPLALADIISVNQIWHFTPSVPAGGGFSADLSLKWTPEVVPDDPNFSETALQIVSLNPATGALRAYATTLDAATRTATARIDSLEAYYTLAVVGPFPKRLLNLPLLTGPNDFTARLNVSAGPQTTGLSLTALDGLGQTIVGEGSPLAGFVAANASSSLAVPAVFGIPPAPPDAWMQGVVNTDAGALLRMERANAADISAAPRAFPRLLVPGLEHSPSRTTELRLANPTRFEAPITLELRNDDGTSAGSFSGILGARNTLAGSLSQIFPGLPASFAGYVIAQADTDLVALALVQSASTLAIVEGQPVEPETSSLLAAPGVVTGGANHRARLSLVNPGTQAASVTLRLIGDNGANLAAPLNLNLAAGQQYRAELGAAFGLNAATAIAGSLRVEGVGAAMTGELTTFDAGGLDLFRASQPLSAEPGTRHAFAHFDNSTGRFTTLSLHNPADVAATVGITIRRPDGSTVGSTALVLAGRARTTRKLAELSPASASLAGGSFVVETSALIFGSALTGEDSLNTLSAIPAHAAEAVAPPKPPGPLKADYRFENSFVSTVAGSPALDQIGEGNAFASETVDGVEQTVLRFPQGNGLTLPSFTGLVAGKAYTIVVLFRFNSVNGYRRLLDFKNAAGESGCYIADRQLFFFLFNSVGSAPTIEPNTWAQVVITRAADGTVTGYHDGGFRLSFKDEANVMLPEVADTLRFFKDNGAEESAGAVARIRLYNTVLTAAEVAGLDRLPLPVRAPVLGFTATASQLVLSWPVTASGFILQAAEHLTPPISWAAVSDTVTVRDGKNIVTISVATGARYYRLSKP